MVVALLTSVLVATTSMALPARPALKLPPLPMKLAGGLFLFGSSVPPERKEFAAELQALAQSTLRTDPRVSMQLGQGIEAGGIFASASSDDGSSMVINFQIVGGSSWAECTAFGHVEDGKIELIDMRLANMDAAMMGEVSLEILVARELITMAAEAPSPTESAESRMAAAMAAARLEALNDTADDDDIEHENRI